MTCPEPLPGGSRPTVVAISEFPGPAVLASLKVNPHTEPGGPGGKGTPGLGSWALVLAMASLLQVLPLWGPWFPIKGLRGLQSGSCCS